SLHDTLPIYQKRIQDQQPEYAEKTAFLGENRKNEIGVGFGQKVEVALGAIEPALAEQTAGADRDLALNDVIAGACRIARGVEEGQHALLLIAMHVEPQQIGRASCRERG